MEFHELTQKVINLGGRWVESDKIIREWLEGKVRETNFSWTYYDLKEHFGLTPDPVAVLAERMRQVEVGFAEMDGIPILSKETYERLAKLAMEFKEGK